jgi:glucose-1-phosphate cytidylyltransferase
MKVVLFCGGLGTRLREYSDTIPKPLVNIGPRPIMWHLMKYYAHYGHKDFVLCLGYRGDLIKEYFLKYDECQSNDFHFSKGGKVITPFSTDIDDWNISFIDTGINSNVGERLQAVREHVKDEEMFLANYSDGLSDMHLPTVIDFHKRNDAVATFVTVRPSQTFHTVDIGHDGRVTEITHISHTEVWINGGYFVMTPEVFDYMQPGEELVEAPFSRLMSAGRLYGYRHDGFWAAMDTLKDKTAFDDRFNRGDRPWEVWRTEPAHS